jgi:protein phosphatase
MTNVGHYRKANEDHFLIAEVANSLRVVQSSLPLDHEARLFGGNQGLLLAVADGIGGQVAGERASHLAIQGVIDHLLNYSSIKSRDISKEGHNFEEELKLALLASKKQMADDVVTHPQRRGMGSTLTLAYIIWPTMFVLHVGDSRLYLYRSGHFRQLTRDHTLASLINDADRYQSDSNENYEIEDEADTVEDVPLSNVLWNVVAAESSELRPDSFRVNLEEGDLLMLCTDGLYQDMSRKRLKSLIEPEASVAETCEHLVAEALNCGGTDNITAIVTLCGSKKEQAGSRALESSPVQSNSVIGFFPRPAENV